MRVPDVSLFELIQRGTIVPDYGAIISVSSGIPVPKAIEWLIENVGARLPKGIKSPLGGTQFLFIGPPGEMPCKVVVSPDFVIPFSHLALRARNKEGFLSAQEWLESKGFSSRSSAVGESEKERWFNVLVDSDFGLAIHLAWRKEVPQDPAVTNGLPDRDPGQMSLGFDELEKDEAADRPADPPPA